MTYLWPAVLADREWIVKLDEWVEARDLPEQVRLDDGMSLPNLPRRKANVDRQVYFRGQPELGLAIRVRHMNVYTRLFSRKEEQAELAVTDDGGRHGRTLPCTATASLCGLTFHDPERSPPSMKALGRCTM